MPNNENIKTISPKSGDPLEALYKKYGYSQYGSYEDFKRDFNQKPEMRRAIFDKHGLSQYGSFEKFESDFMVAVTPKPKEEKGFFGKIGDAVSDFFTGDSKKKEEPKQTNPIQQQNLESPSASDGGSSSLDSENAVVPQQTETVSEVQPTTTEQPQPTTPTVDVNQQTPDVTTTVTEPTEPEKDKQPTQTLQMSKEDIEAVSKEFEDIAFDSEQSLEAEFKKRNNIPSDKELDKDEQYDLLLQTIQAPDGKFYFSDDIKNTGAVGFFGVQLDPAKLRGGINQFSFWNDTQKRLLNEDKRERNQNIVSAFDGLQVYDFSAEKFDENFAQYLALKGALNNPDADMRPESEWFQQQKAEYITNVGQQRTFDERLQTGELFARENPFVTPQYDPMTSNAGASINQFTSNYNTSARTESYKLEGLDVDGMFDDKFELAKFNYFLQQSGKDIYKPRLSTQHRQLDAEQSLLSDLVEYGNWEFMNATRDMAIWSARGWTTDPTDGSTISFINDKMQEIVGNINTTQRNLSDNVAPHLSLALQKNAKDLEKIADLEKDGTTVLRGVGSAFDGFKNAVYGGLSGTFRAMQGITGMETMGDFAEAIQNFNIDTNTVFMPDEAMFVKRTNYKGADGKEYYQKYGQWFTADGKEMLDGKPDIELTKTSTESDFNLDAGIKTVSYIGTLAWMSSGFSNALAKAPILPRVPLVTRMSPMANEIAKLRLGTFISYSLSGFNDAYTNYEATFPDATENEKFLYALAMTTASTLPLTIYPTALAFNPSRGLQGGYFSALQKGGSSEGRSSMLNAFLRGEDGVLKSQTRRYWNTFGMAALGNAEVQTLQNFPMTAIPFEINKVFNNLRKNNYELNLLSQYSDNVNQLQETATSDDWAAMGLMTAWMVVVGVKGYNQLAKYSSITADQVKFNMAKSPQLITAFDSMTKNNPKFLEAVGGKDGVEAIKNEVNEMTKNLDKMPTGTTLSQYSRVLPLLKEKEQIQDEMSNVDEAFKPEYKERIDEVNNKIREVYRESRLTESGQIAQDRARLKSEVDELVKAEEENPNIINTPEHQQRIKAVTDELTEIQKRSDELNTQEEQNKFKNRVKKVISEGKESVSDFFKDVFGGSEDKTEQPKQEPKTNVSYIEKSKGRETTTTTDFPNNTTLEHKGKTYTVKDGELLDGNGEVVPIESAERKDVIKNGRVIQGKTEQAQPTVDEAQSETPKVTTTEKPKPTLSENQTQLSEDRIATVNEIELPDGSKGFEVVITDSENNVVADKDGSPQTEQFPTKKEADKFVSQKKKGFDLQEKSQEAKKKKETELKQEKPKTESLGAGERVTFTQFGTEKTGTIETNDKGETIIRTDDGTVLKPNSPLVGNLQIAEAETPTTTTSSSETTTDVSRKPLSQIETDESRFQNREGLDEKRVDRIANNWNDAQQDPIHIWTDPKNGKTYVLSGHHRFEAAKRAGRKDVKVVDRSKDFNEKQAIEFAKEKANADRAMETPLERATLLRDKRERGDSKESIDEFLETEGKNKTKVLNLSHLNPKGKTVDMLKSFANSEDVSNQQAVEKIADWIGEARRRNPDITDAHENEMFDFLMNKDQSGRITSKAEFVSKVSSITKDLFFDKNEPLNLARFKYKSDGEKMYDEIATDLKNQIKDREKSIDDINARFSDPNRPDYINPDAKDYDKVKARAEEQRKKLRDEIKDLQKKQLQHQQDKGKFTKPSDQLPLFQLKDNAKDQSLFNSKDKTPATKQKLEKKYPQARVVQSESELPQGVKDEIKKQKAENEVKGIAHNGEVWMVADNIKTMGEAEGTWRHERIGHFATAEELGERLDQYAGDIVTKTKGGQRKKVEEIAKRYGHTKPLEELSAKEKSQVGQEYIAWLAENKSLAPKAWNDLVKFVRETLRSLGLDLKISDTEIKALIQKAERNMIESGKIAGFESPMFQKKSTTEITDKNDPDKKTTVPLMPKDVWKAVNDKLTEDKDKTVRESEKLAYDVLKASEFYNNVLSQDQRNAIDQKFDEYIRTPQAERKSRQQVEQEVSQRIINGETTDSILASFKHASERDDASMYISVMNNQNKSAKDLAQQMSDIFDRAENSILNRPMTFKEIRIALAEDAIDRQYFAKNIIAKAGGITVRDYMITRKGASGAANQNYWQWYNKVLRGKSRQQRSDASRVLLVRALVAINEGREAKTGKSAYEVTDYKNMLGMSKDQLLLGMQGLKAEWGEKRFNEAVKLADKVFEQNKLLLKEMFDDGFMSKETYDKLKDLDYVSIKYIDFMKDMDGFSQDVDRTQVMNPQELKKREDGWNDALTVTDIEYLMSTAFNRRAKASAINKTNIRLADHLKNGQQEIDDIYKKPIDSWTPKERKKVEAFEELKKRVRLARSANHEAPIGFKKAFYYEDGAKKAMFMEDKFFESYFDTKGRLMDNAGMVQKFLWDVGTLPTSILKFFATGQNPVFFLVNTPRDFQMIVNFSPEFSNNGLVARFDLIRRGLKGAYHTLKHAGLYADYMKNGGALDFLYMQGRIAETNWMKRQAKSNPRIADGLRRIGNAVSRFNEMSEVGLRVAVYGKAMDNAFKRHGVKNEAEFKAKYGKDADKMLEDIKAHAVAQGRFTADFGVKGGASDFLDPLIPYYNASTQAIRFAASEYKRRPIATSVRLIQTAAIQNTMMFVGGMMAFNYFRRWDGQEPDEKDKLSPTEEFLRFMQSVPIYDRVSGVNIPTGKIKANGEYEYLKIAISQELIPLHTFVSYIIESDMRKSSGMEDLKRGWEYERMAISTSSPIGIKFIDANPNLKAFFAMVGGYDLYRDRDISRNKGNDPASIAAEGFEDPNVDPFYKTIGRNLGVSPARSKVAVESIIGSRYTNPYITGLYAGLDNFFADDVDRELSKQMQKDLGEALTDVTLRRVVRETSEFTRTAQPKDPKIEKRIREVKVEDARIKGIMTNIFARVKDEKLTQEQAVDALQKDILLNKNFDFSGEQMDRLIDTFVMRMQNKDIPFEVLQLKWELNPEIRAMKLLQVFGDKIYFGKPLTKKEQEILNWSFKDDMGIWTDETMNFFNIESQKIYGNNAKE